MVAVEVLVAVALSLVIHPGGDWATILGPVRVSGSSARRETMRWQG